MWLPIPVTPSIPWAWRRSSRLDREDNAWFSRPPGPGLDGVDVFGEIVRDHGWELLTHGTRSPKVAQWPRLRESLPVMSNGQPILRPVSTWDEARRSLLSSATARALAGALLCL